MRYANYFLHLYKDTKTPMGFTKRLIYFLVHKANISNKAAKQALVNGLVKVNKCVVFENTIISEADEIELNNNVIKQKKEFVYIKFYKPVGYESTLNQANEFGLYNFFKEYNDLSIAGRLDKASEGLLLLSNDGKWVQSIIHPKFEKEKVYEVTLNKSISDKCILNFESGVIINKTDVTQPCKCIKINDTLIKVFLKEGKNRQIRKMCKTLGYEVKTLKRIQIAEIDLGTINVGEQIFFKI